MYYPINLMIGDVDVDVMKNTTQVGKVRRLSHGFNNILIDAINIFSQPYILQNQLGFTKKNQYL